MDPLSPFAVAVVLAVAMLVASLLAKQIGIPPTGGRSVPLDGLRGYLAMLVVIFHSGMWYSIVRTDRIETPDSRLFAHLGQDSVLLFFMITGFLFWSKLIDSRVRPVDWTRLYVSRVMRLTPLYLAAFVVMIAVVTITSGFTLHERLVTVLRESVTWLTFSLGGQPAINGNIASRMMLGDNWTLPYEWLFYFSLPAGALLFRSNRSIGLALFGLASLTWLILWAPNRHMLLGFLAGIAAAHAARVEPLQRWAGGRVAAAVALLCVGVATVFFSGGYSRAVVVLLALAFTIVASGNSLFGILTTAGSRALGEMSYSTYLLHAGLQFITFKLILGYPRAAQLSAVGHWLIILCLVVVLLLVSSLTYCFIEKPGMDAAVPVHAWIKARAWRQRKSQLPVPI